MHVNKPFSLVWWPLSLSLLNHFYQSPMMRALQTWMQLWVGLSRSEPFFKHAAMSLEWGYFVHIHTAVLVYNSVVETNWYSIEESIHPECRTFQLTKIHQAETSCNQVLIATDPATDSLNDNSCRAVVCIVTHPKWMVLFVYVCGAVYFTKILLLCVAYSYICVWVDRECSEVTCLSDAEGDNMCLFWQPCVSQSPILGDHLQC